jgi:hypothetical protein
MSPIEVSPWIGLMFIEIIVILIGAVIVLVFRSRNQKAFLEITESKKIEKQIRQEITDTEMELKKDNNELKQKYLNRKLISLRKNLEFFLVNDGNVVKLLSRIQSEFENEVKSHLQETKEMAITKNLLIKMGKDRASHISASGAIKSGECDNTVDKEQYYREKLRRLQDLAAQQAKTIDEMTYYKEMFENIKRRTLPLQEINKKLSTSILEVMEEVKLTKAQKERMKQIVEKLRYVNNELQVTMDTVERENNRLHNEKERLKRELAIYEQQVNSKEYGSVNHINELEAKLKNMKSKTILPSEKEEMMEKELEATRSELEALQKTYLSLVKSLPGG